MATRAATLLYCSSAIGGVVNVEDGRIPSYRASAPLSGTVEVEKASFEAALKRVRVC